MPNPNENPNENETVRRWKIECSEVRIGKSEAKIPKIIHKQRKENFFVLRESKTPTKLETITVEECTPRTMMLMGSVKARLPRSPSIIAIVMYDQVKALNNSIETIT